jgi:indolepyruvate ferredoxin oxidoreductase, beta subunit
MTSPRPLKLLIAALGGEGGGVLTDWIITAAAAEGLPVQSTSIPGVAQRTGATTYYIEIFPVPVAQLGARQPVLALTPSAGDVDVMVASEMLEAGRAIAGGMLARDRKVLVASLHRVYSMSEKTAMADGRFDSGRLFRAIEQNTRQAYLFDMEACARETKSALNAVMLGALAGTGALPIALERFEAAIRDEGKAVESNLRGFRAGLARARGETSGGVTPAGKRPHKAMPHTKALLARARLELPEMAVALAGEAINRLVAYQDAAYAKLYLDRLSRITAVERSLGGAGEIARETARQLGVRMSYEDVIRVAQLKSDPARFARIAREIGSTPEQPVVVVDYFKPGFDELCSILPPSLARRILGLARRRGWMERGYLGLEVRSTSVWGYARLRLLAALRRWRPKSYRFGAEQAAIESWLERVATAIRVSPRLAREVVECARLIKGYGDTHRRGSDNYATIMAELIEPALSDQIPAAFATDAVASARVAALADPEGDSLARTLREIQASRKRVRVA